MHVFISAIILTSMFTWHYNRMRRIRNELNCCKKQLQRLKENFVDHEETSDIRLEVSDLISNEHESKELMFRIV